MDYSLGVISRRYFYGRWSYEAAAMAMVDGGCELGVVSKSN